MKHENKGPAPSRSAQGALRRSSRSGGTALPAPLQRGVESLSGIAMDDVRVHYGSAEPARLQALAFAKGSDIHLAPGQERHLPHEAWHLVQQAQGRVKPTLQMKGGAPVNDDPALEAEADVMGAKAAAGAVGGAPVRGGSAPAAAGPAVAQRVGIAEVEEQPIFKTNHRAPTARDALNKFIAAKRDRYTTYVKTGQALNIQQTNDDTKVTRGSATDTAWVAMSPVFAVQPLAAGPTGLAQYRITEKTGAEVQVKGNVKPVGGQRRGYKFMATGINSSDGGSLSLLVSGPPWVQTIPKPTPKPPTPTVTPPVTTPVATPLVASPTPPQGPQTTAVVQPPVSEATPKTVESVETAEQEEDDEPESTTAVQTPVPTTVTATPAAKKRRKRPPRRRKNK